MIGAKCQFCDADIPPHTQSRSCCSSQDGFVRNQNNSNALSTSKRLAFLEAQMRNVAEQLEARPVVVKRGPGRPRKIPYDEVG